MKPRDITIRTKLGGWIVKVGCQEILFTDKEKMLADLSRYLDDPNTVEEEYQKEAINAQFFPTLENTPENTCPEAVEPTSWEAATEIQDPFIRRVADAHNGGAVHVGRR